MTAAQRPCGCPVDVIPATPEASCQCNPASLTPLGTFRRECRYCEVAWEGERPTVNGDWWQHVKTDEHYATYLRRRDELDAASAAEAAEVARVALGMLW